LPLFDFFLPGISKTDAARDVRNTRKFFSKYVEHRNAKYAAKVCENRPRSHISDIIRLGLTTANCALNLTVLCLYASI